MIEGVLKKVPEYEKFLTVDELNESSARLVSRHPDLVRAAAIGRSTDGEEIRMLRIGDGEEQLLFFACPHPNEPIGAMTLEALSRQLVEDSELRGERYTWNLIKCIDPDSTRLLFTDEIGKLILVVIGSLMVVGFLWIRRIVAIDI